MPVTTTHELDNTLFEGYQQLSGNQKITFTRYVSKILPIDGWHFWVKAELLDGETEPFNKVVSGTLHQSVNQTQEATKSNAITSIILTVNQPIDLLKEVNQESMWLGEYDGSKFSFNIQNAFYDNANQFHYAGDAVYIENSDAFIDDINDLNLDDTVITNCIPLFIALNDQVQIYPAFLNPTNLKPPYATIEVKQTTGVAAGITFNEFDDSKLMQWDKVELSIFGLRKKQLSDFLKYLTTKQLETEAFGIYWLPSIQNENIPQSEVNILTNKKVLSFDVNYVIEDIRNAATAFIENIFVDFFVKEFRELDTLQDTITAENIIIDTFPVENVVIDVGG